MVKPVLIIPDVEKEEDGILYDAAEFVRFSDSHCKKKTILWLFGLYLPPLLSIYLKPFRLEQQVFICLISKLNVIERIAE